MIHPQDETSLLRITGLTKVPEDVRDEYELRLAMFHADGHSGPIGTVGLIGLVRGLGYRPPKRGESDSTVDWRRYPQDGSQRVEARYYGQWVPGRYLGFAPAGMLAIRLDGDEMVRECRRDMVRLADAVPELERAPARAAMLEQPPVAEAVAEPEPAAEDLPEPATFELEDTPRDDGIMPGVGVWAEVDGDYVEAVVFAVEGDEVTVKFATGAKAKLPVSAITLGR